MADKRITELNEKTIPVNDDELALVDSAAIPVETKKVKYSNLFRGAFSNLTIAAGVVTITGRFHTIETQGAAATDDLDTINGGVEGKIIFIRPYNDAHTVVVKHNTGNIWTGIGDVTLNDLRDSLMLVYDGTKWITVCSGHNNNNTDVHGIGSAYAVAKTGDQTLDLSSHHAEHELGATDEIALPDLFVKQHSFMLLKHWANINGFTDGSGGGGSFTTGFVYGTMATGALANGRANVYSATLMNYYTTSSIYNTRFILRTVGTTVLTVATAYFGLFTNPSAPTATEKHIGFKLDGEDIYATNADGATQKITDTGINHGSGITRTLMFIAKGTTVYFYVDGVLVITHTVNVPTGASISPCLYLITNEAVAKTIRAFPMLIVQGV